ncbi:MAG: N-acetylmuramoyl-L-alanine amidase [Anaerolineae bacterium]
MPRPLNDSPYLYGLHDPGGEHIMAREGIYGWVLFTEALGNDPNNQQGGDYSRWADQGFGIIVRLNNGYEPHGTLPFSNRYREFAQRCANFVRNSKGCHIWIIGNEMNFAVERPGVQYDRSTNPPRLVNSGEVILPGMYANCYRQCRDAIKSVPGHQDDQVIVGAVAPWNNQTVYDGNPTGDWVKYLEDILAILGPERCDGVAIHAYTHGWDPKLIYTDTFMNPPFQNRQYNFRVYRDFMNAIPRSMRHLPVYLTETDQDDAWRNENVGWVQRVYGEIDWWNRQPGNQVIRAVILYRWPNIDKWGIDGKAGVIEDFRQAMKYKYNWEEALRTRPAQPEPQPVQPTQPSVPVQPTQPTVDTSPIRFDATGKTAKGLFAAFYRQYGLNLTGYPITDEYIHPETGLKTQDWQRLSMEEWQGTVRLRLVGQEAAELRERIKRLERQIERLQSGTGGPAEPEINDIISQLPRDATRFVKRPLSDIKYIVINHTGVRPEVGVDRVAQAQRARWPGIVGQYFITGDGRIQQTNPIDEAVSGDQAWIYNGINIYVAGNFDETIPSDAQLDALAQLCAWLLYKYNLPEDAIKGVSEFIVTRSPGLQWLQGQRWKDKLLARVRAVPSAPAGPGVPAVPTVDNTQLEMLRNQITALQAQLDDLQARLAVSEQQRSQLQAQIEALLKSGPTPARLPKPTITDISLQLPRNEGALKQRPPGQIKYIVLNHTAVDPNVPVERIAIAHQRRWGAILYQYLITGDGNILQTNPLDQVVDLSQPWIAEGVNIAVAGNFTVEVPTTAQLKAVASLIAWLMQEHQIPVGNIKGVSEFIVTQSPGTQWLQGKKWKEMLLAEVAAVQATVPQGPTPPTPGEAATVAALRAQVTQLQTALNQALAKVTALQQERDRLLAQLREPAPGESQLVKQVQALTQQVQTLTGEKAALSQQVQTLSGEKAALSQQVQALTSEKATLTKQVQALTSEKMKLSQQVQALTNDKAALTKQVQTLTGEKAGLGQQVQTLSQQVNAAAQEKQALNKKISDLEARIAQLQSGGGLAAPAGPTGVQAPEIVNIVEKLPRHPTLKYDRRTLDKITHIAIHHTAAPANVTPERIAQYHVDKDWPGMGYHFYVTPDGTIYQTNELETISYHVYQQNHYSVGITIAGNFINGAVPTPRQIEQVGHLVAWLMQKLNIPLKNVLGHKEFPQNVTTCPGSDWITGQNWKAQILDRVKAVQAGRAAIMGKTIGHYMLFWQRADNWAKEDWAAATNYFARFRPTAGFSPDDAKQAEYVTIVGGVAGVPYEVEQMLIAAGCKVERLAGVDFADTKRMLDELASTGRRFKTFNV